MGMFDSIIVFCPRCGEEHEFQSKSGECLLDRYFLDEAPEDVLVDSNRHSPSLCNCGVLLTIDIKNRRVIVL